MNIQRRKINELIADGAILALQDGNHGEKHPTASDYVEDGIPFLMARDFRDGQVDLEGACKIPKSLGDSLRIGFARTGDVLLTHKGTVGLVAIVPPIPDYIMLTPQVTYYRTNSEKLFNGYLKYAFQAPFFQNQLVAFSAQSTRPYVGITAQKDLLLDVPPLPDQKRIAGFLSGYDELIENNRRRIRILEATARALYRVWFVSGRSSGDIRNGEVKNGNFGELCALVRKPFSEPLHARLPLLDLSRMTQNSLAPGDTGATSELATSRIVFEPGDTLFGAIRCYLHKVNLAHFPGVTNTSVFVLRPRSAAFRTITAIVASDAETIRWADTHSSGTKMPVISWSVLQTMPTRLPSESFARAFEEVAGPLLDQIGTLASRIQNLRRTRDLLLPRLLAGRITVEVGAT